MKATFQCPKWFIGKDYGQLANLNAAGWAAELTRVKGLLQDIEHREKGEPTFAEEWGHCRGERALNLVPAFIYPPIVERVESGDISTLTSLEMPSMLVQVYLRATDRDIVTHFRKVLVAARSQHPAPVKKSGPKAPNGGFDRFTFDRWRRWKIIELAELINWFWHTGATAKDADFGRLLFPTRPADMHKLIHRSRTELYRAIDSIPALTMQAESEQVLAKGEGRSKVLPETAPQLRARRKPTKA